MDKDMGRLNKFVQNRLNRLMIGSLEWIEQGYGGDTEEFKLIRNKILRLGNDQKRDMKEFFMTYESFETFEYDMKFKPIPKEGKE